MVLYWPPLFFILSKGVHCMAIVLGFTLCVFANKAMVDTLCLVAHLLDLVVMIFAFLQGRSKQFDYIVHEFKFIVRAYLIILNNLYSDMGNQCCGDQSVSRPALEKLQHEITMPISNKEYYVHDWPLDQAVQVKINELKQEQEFKELFTTHQMMKHKFYDKYYIGQWSQDGYPQGKGVLLVPDTFLYHGEFHNTPSGKGIVELFRDKIKYEGGIYEGKAQGQGKIQSADGKYSFEGIMTGSVPRSGVIKINNTHDESKSYVITLNNFPQGRSEIEYGDGRRYYGFINKRSLAPEGQGVATFLDGSRYEGNWEEGQMHGEGTFTWKDGSSYKGDYQHGRKHGIGTFVFPSKKYYEGQWVHGRQSGKGTLYDQNGQIIQRGIWKDGVYTQESA